MQMKSLSMLLRACLASPFPSLVLSSGQLVRRPVVGGKRELCISHLCPDGEGDVPGAPGLNTAQSPQSARYVTTPRAWADPLLDAWLREGQLGVLIASCRAWGWTLWVSSLLQHSLVMCLRASHLITGHLSFLTCRVGIIALNSQRDCGN